jgi:8-oxo-dGTP pyrophosphatase MutT (NUDIX family)
MYKVFLENIPLHLVEKTDKIPDGAILIQVEQIGVGKEGVTLPVALSEMSAPIFVPCEFPEVTFHVLFGGYDHIEAAGGIVKRNEEFLFIKRNGRWDIPKGKMEEGEDPMATAVREIEEECGLHAPILNYFLGCTYHTYLYKGNPTVKKTHWYALTHEGSKAVKGQIEEGITEVKWFKASELNIVERNTYASIREVIQLYFNP